MTEKQNERMRLSDLQNKKDGKGLTCGKCGCRHFRTPHTRPQPDGILRERVCRNCGKRVLTKEKVWAEAMSR